MAEAKTALQGRGPMQTIRTITVNADGTVASGDLVAFAPFAGGQIQFYGVGLPSNFTAVFTPQLFGSATGGDQTIYANNDFNRPLSPNNRQFNGQVASYMISGPGITTQGPYCVTVGGAYLAVQVDASGNFLPSQIRIPNSGLISFNSAAAAQITYNVTWNNGTGPFSTLSIPPGQSMVHIDAADCSFTLTPQSPVANPGSTVKVGSGGSGPGPFPGSR